ncbi:hypothetical protein R3P38DRAFT_3312009 [Favolaschia claudopus]|uniref:Zn(2)-C6 fungal-type domain-containing protein n=1 Tax=Favolaschia claudopus TaxID=2862362 RepID=A0AAW0CCR0_9AGAR
MPGNRTSTRRAKTAQACSSCKKHKTRCEILDHTSKPIRCHRCKVLSIACSYEQRPLPDVSRPASHPKWRGEFGTLLKPPIPKSASSDPQRPTSSVSFNKQLWSFIEDENLDWSAPMLTIERLAAIHSSDASSPITDFVRNDVSLEMILPEGRIDYLIDLFSAQYTPWLNFNPIRNSKNPLVDIACSAVAARHLEGAAGREVRLRLQALSRESITQLVFKPGASESVEAVQSLLILSLWPPFGSPESDVLEWDSRALISAAVRMGVNLGLNEAAAAANDMQTTQYVDPMDVAEAVERARLWIALTNTDSMLCLGTRRTPSSSRSSDDLSFVKFPAILDAQTNLQDLRLGLIGRLLDFCEEGDAICADATKDGWAHNIKSVLDRIKREQRWLIPLPVVFETDKFYLETLHIMHGICRLLVIYNVFWELGSAPLPEAVGPRWAEQLIPGRSKGREALITLLARDMVRTGESLLVSFLATPTARLCTLPDTYFTVIALTGTYLVGANFFVYQFGTTRMLSGATELVLEKTVARLYRAACGPGHAAQRAAILLQNMLAKWKLRGRPSSTDTTQLLSTDSSSQCAELPPLPMEGMPSLFTFPTDLQPSMFTMEPYFDLESFRDVDGSFWDGLMQQQWMW